MGLIQHSAFFILHFHSHLPHRNHPKPDQRGGTVVGLLAVDADVVAGVEVANIREEKDCNPYSLK